MTIRLEMLKAVSLSRGILGDSTELVVTFLKSKQQLDGGFIGRGEQSDIYYTMFAVEALMGLGESFCQEKTSSYIRQFNAKEPYDLIHLASLIRCHAGLSDGGINKNLRKEFLQSLQKFRSEDGGYSNGINTSKTLAYGCFCALGAYQDLEADIPERDSMLKCLNSLITPEGGFANDQESKSPSTNPTAAAMIVLHHLNQSISPKTSDWLINQCSPEGGFKAIPDAPLPDLLSTATALHALATTGCEIDSIRERCLDFLDSLWSSRGGFYSCRADTILDCEYTYYGLLALGNLVL